MPYRNLVEAGLAPTFLLTSDARRDIANYHARRKDIQGTSEGLVEG
jgi:hypothetical protein